MTDPLVNPGSPPAKKPRLASKKSDAVVAPSDALPDEDTAAPPSAAAGAHAKPLSALFSAQALVKSSKGKGKAKAEEVEEVAESFLAEMDSQGE